jgi:tetraacyldisaccharide 4'-kinase
MIKAISILLFPFSVIYGIITGIRNFCFNNNILKSHTFKIPVICVGNITVGGTGKTPHVEYIIKHLKDNCSIAVISRGYRRKTKGFVRVTKKSDASEVGDEPLQIARKFNDVKVVVDEKRKRGIQRIEDENNPPDVVIMDDGYQHRKVKPGIRILLIDYNRPLFKDHLLPFGRLRERRSEKRRASIIIVSKVPKDEKPIQKSIFLKKLNPYPYQSVFFSYMEYAKKLCSHFSDKKEATIDLLSDNRPVLAVAGIANPNSFFCYLNSFTDNFRSIKFADHAEFNDFNIEKIINEANDLSEDSLIITTEKDYVKISNSNYPIDEKTKERFYFLPVKVTLKEKDEKEFLSILKKYIKTGKEPGKIIK